ncbi:arabinose-5-phosphate isomerase [Betaproteobacteria bacterium SCGC AG-212-J23]|nr:arabinose-5-phosphate isomerase [Betaproteobacteria bacterium SCGC AG-212-J23]
MIKVAPRPAKTRPAKSNTLDLARNVLRIEADAVRALAERLDERFLAAVELVRNRKGRVVVSGMGKSGHIARKIASTLSSTGTPAYFVHPAEASHGDLGMIESGDVLIAISYSGSSSELLEIVPQVKRRGARLIAMTGNADSPLAREADVHLDATVAQEACPLNLAPTASTTAALALGDALAVALLDAHGFTAADFARTHPRGKLPHQALANQALLHVAEVMCAGEQVPQVKSGGSLREALKEMTRGRLGMTAVVDAAGRLKGVFTDGDLRRTLEKSSDLERRIDDVMSASPKTVRREMLAAEAVHVMEQAKINQLLVVDAQGALVGALNMHDLFRAKVI